MYLQSLQIFGFKSFANKTTLNFHPGVTAIVGPNGCGKSNVLDAMRWVLGEQSAKALRGGEMADVIFSGTDSKPALGMAEVSMTFADCEAQLGVEYNEVCITRRVFRDGSSEYLLNKVPCRLRDINLLFMGTGIGRSAYSIMEQGKIDLILSSRPEDRRTIFEEAAGITKFKVQKKEALRKLEATEANLLRVTDVVKEVKRQIGSLQRQAAKARRYQSLINDLRILDTHHSRYQYEQLDQAQRSAVAEIERLRELQTDQQAAIEEQEAGTAGQRRELDQLEHNLSAARAIVQELKNNISNAESRIGFNQERLAEFASLVDRYERDIASAEEKLMVQEEQILNTDLELEQISTSLKSEEARLQEKNNAASELAAERQETERTLNGTSNSINRIENRINALRSEISSFINQRDGSEARLTILGNEIAHLKANCERLELQTAETKAHVEQNTRALEDHALETQQAEGLARSIQAELEQVKRLIAAEQRTLSEKESRLEVLQQLNEAGEGLSEGAQSVLRGLDNPDFFKPAILGALATHIEVEPQFVAAIEAALGQNLQAIVMKDTMVAESVIKTLSSKKLGRALLAIRDFLPQHTNQREMFFVDGAIAWAADKVKVITPELEPLIAHLLNNFVIANDLGAALQLKEHHPQLCFATLAGETVSELGIIQGGQAGEASGSLLQRKNQILQLDAEAVAVRAKLAELNSRHDEAAEQLASSQARVTELRDEAQKLSLSLSTYKGQLGLLEREMAEANKKLGSTNWERESVEARHREASEKISMQETELEQAGASIGDLHEQQNQLQSTLETLRTSEAEMNSELNELRIKVATEKQRYNSLTNQRQPMAARMAELSELIEQRRRDIDNYRSKTELLEADCTRLQEQIETTQVQVSEASQQVSDLAQERTALVATIDSMETGLRQLRTQISETQEKRSQQEVKQTQIQLRIENLCEHVMRRYQIDIREFEPDSYAFSVTLRDMNKRQSSTRESAPSTAPSSEEASIDQAGRQESADIQPDELPSAIAASVPVPEPEQGVDWKRIEQLVTELTQKLDSMGPINMDAIQEYDELEQRHSFLEQQFTDLTNAKAELLDVISKINNTTREMFAETFEKVRINFQEMFVELFGGGKANLVLQDENDPLESGIDIIAKPPGKQLTSISLLSGGERTMTAVALLFSIYMVKPSPFCVLDEMDAPLDESNIMRFIKILDRFVGQSQFVVITHNKRTIAKADVLYGVTMEEHGISKLVGVRFSHREESQESSDLTGTANPVAVPSVAESFGKTDKLHSENIQAG